MSTFFGPLRRARRFAGVPAALLLSGMPAAADQQPILTLAEAEQLAVSAEPGFLALEARADALSAEAAAAAALPAPSLRAGINNFPIEAGGFTSEGMTNAGLTYRQAFPPGDVRDRDRERLDWASKSLLQLGETRLRTVRQAVREAFVELYRHRGAISLLEESRPFFEDLADVARSRYTTGRVDQKDLLQAELELSRLDRRLLDRRGAAREAEARLTEWIGLHARRPLPGALPSSIAVPDIDAMRTMVESHPDLLAASARIESLAAASDVERERRKPSWSVDIGYAYRDGFTAPGRPRSDFVSVGVTIDLPVLRRQAVNERYRASLAEQSAAEAEHARLAARLATALEEHHARWQSLGEELRLFDERILPQAAGQAEAALLAYQSDAADFDDVMRARIAHLDARIEQLDTDIERARTWAALAWIGGF